MDLQEYDVYHLGMSGGKDSTAALLWAVYESDIPLSRLVVTCCDTGNEDAFTYAFLAMLAERVFPIRYIFPERDFWELARHKKRFPSRKARFCTQHLKVIPSIRYVQGVSGRVLMIDGVRRAEGHNGNDRGETPLFEHDDVMGVDKLHPMAEWSIDDVWGIHQRHLSVADVCWLVEDDPDLSEGHKAELISKIRDRDVPCNPLYYMGASRVGCFPCINSRKSEVRAMAKFRPGRVNFIEGVEGSFNGNPNMYSSFFARNTVPERFRSKEVVTASGELMRVATIRDVVDWSQTAWGARQYQFDFAAYDDILACDMKGMCE